MEKRVLGRMPDHRQWDESVGMSGEVRQWAILFSIVASGLYIEVEIYKNIQEDLQHHS